MKKKKKTKKKTGYVGKNQQGLLIRSTGLASVLNGRVSMRMSWLNKVIGKVRKTQHCNPLFGHIGDEISKNREKEYTGLERRMKLSLAAKLVLIWVCPVLSFSWTPSAHHCCYVYCNYKCSRAWVHFILSLSISYPYLIMTLRTTARGDEASNEGWNSGPTGHDFRDNSDGKTTYCTREWARYCWF
jgi:hypothetical protein